MKILVTGATGFIGRPLCRRLIEAGHEVVALSRVPSRARVKLDSGIQIIQGDIENSTPDLTRLGRVDAVIHLAGESIGGGRWTATACEHILKSRSWGTTHLLKALDRFKVPPRIFIAASAVGFYGSRGDEILKEGSATGTGFLAQVCSEWEAASARLPAEVRRVILRFGLVLGPDGGALEKILPPFRAGAGGKIGNGKQWMSWIHREDLIRLLMAALEDSRYEGVFNAVAPEPVTNATFTETLGQVLHRPTFMTVPVFALKMLLGNMAEETVLASQRVLPSRLREMSFEYKYPGLPEALSEILTEKTS